MSEVTEDLGFPRRTTAQVRWLVPKRRDEPHTTRQFLPPEVRRFD